MISKRMRGVSMDSKIGAIQMLRTKLNINILQFLKIFKLGNASRFFFVEKG